jgi:hypothetical protein
MGVIWYGASGTSKAFGCSRPFDENREDLLNHGSVTKSGWSNGRKCAKPMDQFIAQLICRKGLDDLNSWRTNAGSSVLPGKAGQLNGSDRPCPASGQRLLCGPPENYRRRNRQSVLLFIKRRMYGSLDGRP